MTEPHASPRRLVSLDAGVVMVVTDLHGDWPLYQHLRDVFLELRARNLTQTLVFTGDLIHSERTADRDQSLAIVLDLIGLQASLGEHLVVLLGNHEMPHIYHIPLARGDHLYTPRFEREMGEHRERILGFFRQLPFFVRTRAGVALCHAGGFPEADRGEAMATLLAYGHRRVLDAVQAQLVGVDRATLRAAIAEQVGIPYDELARDLLAADDPEDRRYDDYLVGALASHHEDFNLLWSALFSRNEHADGMAAYADQVSALLTALSEGYTPQRVLVTGHIGCRDGYRILARGQHLRVASGAHAHPYASARYLIFDAAKPIADTEALVPGIVRVFGED